MNEQAATAEVKKARFCEKTSEGTVVTFTFGNGEVRTLDLAELSEETQQDLMVHGALQKIGDSYSSAAGDYGFGIAQAEKTIQNLRDGNWGTPRTAGEGKQKIGELATALAALQGVDPAVVTAALEAATEDQRKAFRAHPAVKLKIAELRAAKAAEALAKANAAPLPSLQ